jgi:putative ABC transport system permease protein
LAINVVNVKLAEGVAQAEMVASLEELLDDVEVVDRVAAYEASPGYTEQQSTINTQRGFTLLIGVLVVGGFFQIQTLQKVGQVGVLKALGASNWVVGLAATIQIVATNMIGVAVGAAATLLLTLFLPPTIPIIFEGQQVTLAVVTLLLIGPMGGLVSIRYLLGVEPLTALGLSG